MTPKKSVVKIQNTEDFMSCHELSMGLLDILKNGGSFEELLKYGSVQIDKPVMLVDVSYNYLDSAGTENIDDEPVWEYTVKNGFMPNYFLNSMAKEEKNGGVFVYDLRPGHVSHINHSNVNAEEGEDNNNGGGGGLSGGTKAGIAVAVVVAKRVRPTKGHITSRSPRPTKRWYSRSSTDVPTLPKRMLRLAGSMTARAWM